MIGSKSDEVGLVLVAGKKYTMHRCIVAPLQKDDLLKLAADLALKAINRKEDHQRGNVILFLPGMSEIKEVQKLLQEADKDLKVPIFHSGADKIDQMIPADQTVFCNTGNDDCRTHPHDSEPEVLHHTSGSTT